LGIPTNVKNQLAFSWKLNCNDEKIVTGYNISYCLLSHANSNVCSSDLVYNFVNNSENTPTQYIIEGLKDYREYAIFLSLLSTNKSGIPEKIVLKTVENGNKK
jgi:hypothetical protein